MSKATIEEWSRYYELASARRRANGGDPLERILKRQAAQHQRFFVASSLLLAALFSTFYWVLVR